MHIQVVAPKNVTRLTKYVNTVDPDFLTLRKVKKQNAVQNINAGPSEPMHQYNPALQQPEKPSQGTPMRFTRLNILGALPSAASAKRVREPMYRSELAALITKIRMTASRKIAGQPRQLQM
jgi:hypothetical protein